MTRRHGAIVLALASMLGLSACRGATTSAPSAPIQQPTPSARHGAAPKARTRTPKPRHHRARRYLTVAQSPSATFVLASYVDGSHQVTIYRLSQDLSSVVSTHHLKPPIKGVGDPDSAFALDSEHLWVGFVDIARGGFPARLDRTKDGGDSWQVSPYAGHGFHGGDADQVLFSTPEDGVQITYSGVAEYSAIYRTSNGGARWRVIASNRHGRQRLAPAIGPIYRTADGQLWQIGDIDESEQVLTHSTDGGREWHRIHLPHHLAQKRQVDSVTTVGDTVLVSYSIRHSSRHHCRFGILSYRDGAWSFSRSVTLHCPNAEYGNGTIVTASATDWTVRPDAGTHPPLLTTSNAGRTWTVHHVPAKVDDLATLTMQAGGTALLSGSGYYAPSASGPWSRLKLP